jgi:hypothetical protein
MFQRKIEVTTLGSKVEGNLHNTDSRIMRRMVGSRRDSENCGDQQSLQINNKCEAKEKCIVSPRLART